MQPIWFDRRLALSGQAAYAENMMSPYYRLALMPLSLFLAGCAAQVNNVFVDTAAPARSELTTPSADGYRSGMPAWHEHRAWQASRLEYHRFDVTHWPIWWEDPFLDKGNGTTDEADRDAADRLFAVTWVDYLAIPYSAARCVLNTAAWPISAAVTLPGTVMASDGRISRQALGHDHDAQRVPMETEAPDRIRRDGSTAPTANSK